MDAYIDLLGGTTVMNILDYSQGYLQVKMSLEDRNMTQLTCHDELIRPNRIAVGLKCARDLTTRKRYNIFHSPMEARAGLFVRYYRLLYLSCRPHGPCTGRPRFTSVRMYDALTSGVILHGLMFRLYM